MPKFNQKGFAHFLIPIILLIGLIAGVYLITSKNSLNLFSKASADFVSQTITLNTIDDGYSINKWGHNETVPNVRIGSNYDAGFRFTLPIPANAQITSAVLSGFVNYTSSSVKVVIKAENVLNSTPLTGGSLNAFIPNRTYFRDSINWTLTGSKVNVMSSDIKTLIQNIVNQPNWQVNNNILIALLKGTDANYGDLVSKEGDAGKAVKLTVAYKVPVSQTITLPVIDDGYSIKQWGHNEKAPNVRIGSNYDAGFRFTLPIPANAQITSASMTVFANVTSSPTTVNVKAENVLDSTALTEDNSFVSKRAYFNDSVSWSLSGNGVSATSPDIKTLIQNIVSQPNWQTNNSILIALLKTDTNYGDLVSKEGDLNNAKKSATLNITYVIPTATPAPTPTPILIPPSPTPTRDPLKWPFSSKSIWNMPIGSNARYVPANLTADPGNRIAEARSQGKDSVWVDLPAIDPERIFVRTDGQLTDVYYISNANAWGDGSGRCNKEYKLGTVKIPAGYTVPKDGTNSVATFLKDDGRSLRMGQPLASCNGYVTMQWLSDNGGDIYGDGIIGAHGGSSLSGLGGSLRVGELGNNQTPVRHALKIDVYAASELYKCTTPADCYRWPARNADGYAAGRYGSVGNNSNSAMKMGALLAIPKWVNLDSLGLKTEPAKKLAWTLQNYGAYIVDDALGPAMLINTEEGPDGSFRDYFRSQWGFDFKQGFWYDITNSRYNDITNKWISDIQTIRTNLYVVDNNGPDSIGGGGTPLQPLAPEILF